MRTLGWTVIIPTGQCSRPGVTHRVRAGHEPTHPGWNSDVKSEGLSACVTHHSTLLRVSRSVLNTVNALAAGDTGVGEGRGQDRRAEDWRAERHAGTSPPAWDGAASGDRSTDEAARAYGDTFKGMRAPSGWTLSSDPARVTLLRAPLGACLATPLPVSTAAPVTEKLVHSGLSFPEKWYK